MSSATFNLWPPYICVYIRICAENETIVLQILHTPTPYSIHQTSERIIKVCQQYPTPGSTSANAHLRLLFLNPLHSSLQNIRLIFCFYLLLSPSPSKTYYKGKSWVVPSTGLLNMHAFGYICNSKFVSASLGSVFDVLWNFDVLGVDFTETQKRKCSIFKVTMSLEAVPTKTMALMKDPNHRMLWTMGIQTWRQKQEQWKPGINTESRREIAESEPIATTPLFAIFFPTQPK